EKTSRPKTAKDLLRRIDHHSPFAPLALTVKASTCDGEQMLKALAPLDPLDKRFTLTLKGWPESHFVFLQELISLQQSSEDRHLLRFLIRQQRILGSVFSRQAAMRFVSHHPESSRVYDRSFGMPGPFDRARIIALIDDHELHSPHEDYDAWEETLHHFRQTFDSEDRQNKLRTALLLRRIAEILEKSHSEQEELKEVLEESLQFDPDDPPTYLHLIRLYREDRRFKEARRIQDQALARYPQDTEVLLAIVETSIASNAYKKAATFARRILAIDPINPKVRKILFDAHLAHARKQVRQAKPTLALKELEQAVQWDESQAAKNQIELIQGIMELNHDKPAGIKRLQETMEQLKHSLTGRFLLLMEADRLQRRPEPILKLLKFPWFKADPEQVMELTHTLRELPKDDEKGACNTLRQLHKPLKKSARVSYQQQDMGLICEVFKRFEQPLLRQQYAKAALKHWPKSPLFVYHRLDAQHHLRNKDYRDLEQALEQAHETGDMRTAHRIDELLKISFSFGGAPFPGPGPGDNIEDELIRELINELGAEGFLDALESLNLPDFDAIRETVGDKQLSELFERIANGEDPLEETRSPFPNPFKKPRKRPRGKPRKSTTKTGAGAKDDDNNQLDLF
ncbi:MAG: tetratricopeptide repeat protein, partial [Pseudomonadota bacterium]